MTRILAVAAMVAAALAAPDGLRAQRPGRLPSKGTGKGQALLERLQSMTPDERRRMMRRLPPERRLQMENRLRDFERMSPDERRQARRSLDNFESLPPERRGIVRNLFASFNRMPPRRRMALRGEIRRLGNMEDQARRERLSSEAFRRAYSVEEQDWIARLSDALHTPLDQ